MPENEKKEINTDETGYINTEELRDIIAQEEQKKDEKPKKVGFFRRLFGKKNKEEDE